MAVNNRIPRHELEHAIQRINRQITFKDAHLELMTDGRMEELMDFFQEHFFPDEPMAISIGYNIDEESKAIFRQMFKDNLSIILVSNATNKIIACRGIAIGNKNETIYLSTISNPKLKVTLEFFKHKDNIMNVYKRFDTDTCVEFLILGTHRDYRKRGIATKIFQAALLFSKELGLDTVYIKGEGSSNFSQKIYENFNFETIHTTMYGDYKIDGDVVFKITGIHKSFKVYVKKIE